VELTTRKHDDGVTEISVADRGPGLPPEMLEHLFEPFHTTKRDGMGLGLSISRTIVEAHRGKLKYDPNPGGGTIFRIMLPAAIER
jgi:signal transduction histidine kinase